MSRLLGKDLTPELFERLKGADVGSLRGKAILLATVDERQWPHPAMVSYYELVAKDRTRLDLAIGAGSTTAKNLRRAGKITIVITDRGINYYLKANAREIRESMPVAPSISLFRLELEQLLEDQDPDAMITGGVTYDRPENEEIDRMVEQILQAIRSEP